MNQRKVDEQYVANLIWETALKISSLANGKSTDFHKNVGDLLAEKIESTKIGSDALEDTVLCLLRSNNFPLEVKVLIQDDDGSIANVNVIVGLEPDETEEAAMAFMVKEAQRIVGGDKKPTEAEVLMEIMQQSDTDECHWVCDTDELVLRSVDEVVVSYRKK